MHNCMYSQSGKISHAFICIDLGRHRVIDYTKNLDVTVIIMKYIDKNLDAIDYVELAFKSGNPIFDVTYCRLSDKRFENL